MSKLWLGKCLFVCVIGINCGSFLCGAWAQEPPTAGGGAATAPVSRPATTDATRQGTPAGMPAVQNVPRLIKFSGTLKDSKGQPKSGVAGVTFAIYAEQEGGAPLWMETQNVTFEEGGKYTVLLGANSSEGVPVELFNGSGEWRVASEERSRSLATLGMTTVGRGERWLGVEGLDIQATARVLLVSVPYALKAADAETLGGLPASAFVMANAQRGSMGTGTGESGTQAGMPVPLKPTEKGTQAGMPVPLKPTEKGTQAGMPVPLKATEKGAQAGVPVPLKGGTKGAGTTAPKGATTPADTDDFVAKYDANANLVPSAIYEANGSVGIGTNSPAAALHVNGDTLLVNSGTTAQVRVNGPLSSGRFGQDANGTFLANDTSGSALRFLTSNSSLNEWMRIGSAGSVNIGSAQAAKFGEVVFAPDNLDTVHSAIGQAGSQYHFRLSRSTPDVGGSKDFLISPYTSGMAIEYPGTLEFWSGSLSVHTHPSHPGNGAYFWVGDEIDSGGLYVTAFNNGGGNNSYVTLAADRFSHTSHGSFNFVVRNTTDAFRFNFGASGSEVVKAEIATTASASNMDLYNGPVQATLRAQNGSNANGKIGVDAEIGSTSNHPVSLFANNGAARATLFPSGNFSIGNSGDTAALAVGTAAQFQVSAAGAVTIGGGTPIKQHLSVEAAPAIAGFDGFSCNTVTVPVNGAAEGDSVALGMPNALGALDGVTWFGWVSGAGVVSIRGCNATPHKLAAPPAANIRVDVWQH